MAGRRRAERGARARRARPRRESAGAPEHTPENIEKDIDYFVGLKPMFCQVGPLTPCPGTKLYREFQKEGRLGAGYSYQHFHLWKDDGIDYAHFGPGGIRHWYNVAHEKLRTVNGPPTLQFCDLNLRAYETLRQHSSEYLRHQAELAKDLAQGALPLVRVIAKRPPSPAVQAKAREVDRRARELLGEPSLPMRVVSKAVETIALARAERQDALERAPVVSDPGLRVSRYDGSGGPPTRAGNFGRADLKRQVARPGAIWPARRVRLADAPAEKVRVEQHEVREETAEVVKKKKRLAVVD